MARWLALLVLLGAALAQTPLELEAFRLTNEARKAHGLAALAWDDAAYRAARAHALDMLERGFFDHVNPDGLGPADRMWAAGVLEVTVGENLAFYEGYTPEYAAGVVVDDWLRSPPHRRNLLKPEFTHLGLALVQRGDRIAVVQNFVARPFRLWVWQTPSQKREGRLSYQGTARATVGLFVNDAFVTALQPPRWSGELDVDPQSKVSLGLWNGGRYLLACAFTLPATACRHPRIEWTARYTERTVASVRLQLGLPAGEHWLAYGPEPRLFRRVQGDAVVEVPLSWQVVWVGTSQEDKIEYTHRIPLLGSDAEPLQKGARP
ncbi:CAP domain-containing protein [Oceanithermus sp.]|uniref:CAP domain-containing protein n=1 Tax=Oceanithermus sp. TaxID=2268145 RepID=UPI00257A99CA|nr:CAP domain-containing protein [Oceanithermus sp.]